MFFILERGLLRFLTLQEWFVECSFNKIKSVWVFYGFGKVTIYSNLFQLRLMVRSASPLDLHDIESHILHRLRSKYWNECREARKKTHNTKITLDVKYIILIATMSSEFKTFWRGSAPFLIVTHLYTSRVIEKKIY